MNLKLYILSCDRGATLVELIVASLSGIILVGLTHSAVLHNHRLYQKDMVRTELTQSLRSALDIVATEAREAGERLPQGFPAIEVVDGEHGNPDELVVRRNIMDEVLVSCSDINAGTNNADIILFKLGALTPACTYPAQQTALDKWRQHRLDNDDTVKIYVFNQSTKLGEFVDYINEDDQGGNLQITKAAGGWENDYVAEYTSVYILTEWRYRIDGDYLQVVENEDESEPLNIAFGIENFQVEVSMQDGSTKTDFLYTDPWINIKSVDVTLSGETEYKQEIIDTSYNAKFFPRNILSN